MNQSINKRVGLPVSFESKPQHHPTILEMYLRRNGFLPCQLLLPFLINSTPKFVSSYFTNMAPFVTHRENGVITVSPKVETNQSGMYDIALLFYCS